MALYLERIARSFEKLSPAKRACARFIVENWAEAAFLSTRQIARRLGVNEAQLVRLAGQLGYSGFRELQRELQEHVRLVAARGEEAGGGPRPAPGDPVAATFACELRNLEDTYKMNTAAALAGAARSLSAARRVYVVGARNTSISNVLAVNLNELLRNTLALPVGTSSWAGYMKGIGEKDVVVGVALGPQYGPACDMVRYGRGCGARVIAITDSPNSPLGALADIVLVASCMTAGRSSVSQVGTLFLIDALVSLVGQEAARRPAGLQEQLEWIYDQFGAAWHLRPPRE
jgi:DNA-binding MurR/RpiR family transcriptional regulator